MLHCIIQEVNGEGEDSEDVLLLHAETRGEMVCAPQTLLFASFSQVLLCRCQMWTGAVHHGVQVIIPSLCVHTSSTALHKLKIANMGLMPVCAYKRKHALCHD